MRLKDITRFRKMVGRRWHEASVGPDIVRTIHYHEQGPYTVAEVIDPHGKTICVGVSRRNLLDPPNPEKGRMIALSRAADEYCGIEYKRY